jgi:hypothetical protein
MIFWHSLDSWSRWNAQNIFFLFIWMSLCFVNLFWYLTMLLAYKYLFSEKKIYNLVPLLCHAVWTRRQILHFFRAEAGDSMFPRNVWSTYEWVYTMSQTRTCCLVRMHFYDFSKKTNFLFRLHLQETPLRGQFIKSGNSGRALSVENLITVSHN